MARLTGRVAVVTGGGRGAKAALGATFAAALAAEGAEVVVADRIDCSAVVEEIRAAGGMAHQVEVDVGDEGSVRAMVAETERRFGRLDILVNNAAIGSNIAPIAVEDLPTEQWDELMAVNVRGPFLCVKASVALMRRNGYGKIINVGSSTILAGLPHRLHYVAAKGAIMAMTRALARELGPYGIRVNTLAPGLVMNAFVEAAMAERPGALDALRGARSIPSDLFPADIVGSLIFLASSESDPVTGQFIVLDYGGAMS